MKIVDASVVVDLVCRRLEPARLGEEDLAAPHLLDSEVLNAVRGRVLGGKLSPAEADAAVRAFGALVIDRRPVAPLRERIWELRHNLSAYDAAYVALAEALHATSLLTRDEPLSRTPGLRCRVERI